MTKRITSNNDTISHIDREAKRLLAGADTWVPEVPWHIGGSDPGFAGSETGAEDCDDFDPADE
jgi:hypothetical protein